MDSFYFIIQVLYSDKFQYQQIDKNMIQLPPYIRSMLIIEIKFFNSHKTKRNWLDIFIYRQSSSNTYNLLESVFGIGLIQFITISYTYISFMSQDKDNNVYVVEQVEISSQSEGSEFLEDVHDLDDIEDSLNDINQLDKLMASTIRKSQMTQKTHKIQQIKPVPKHVKRLEVIDDFIRNFLIKNSMTKTLNSFQKQWYEYVQNSKNQGDEIPDAYLENQVLKDKYQQIEDQLNNAVVMSEKAKATYDKLLKERDFHKMHHQRVQKQKKKLLENIQKLNALRRQYSSKYDELVDKYNFAMKEKMLIKIERDRLKIDLAPKKQTTLPSMEKKSSIQATAKSKFTPFPTETTNPFLSKNIQPYNYKNTVLSKTQKGHSMAVCAVAIHPRKPIVGTGSDDMFWKIWTVNQSQLIMSGQGHKDWVSSLKFHPKGLHIVTASGDSTVKIWDFVNTSCTFTFKDHKQPIWSIDLNQTGDYIATGSMDHSSRLLDINVGKCRAALRGHVDSVNSVHFKPFSNILGTSSADKTVSTWDVRTNLCIQTFYGHNNSVNGCKFSPKGDKLTSCDSNGIVKSWDLRMNKQINSYDCNKSSANCISVDQSGTFIAVGCDNALIHILNDVTGEREHILKGHQEKSRVQAVQFDMNSKMIISGGSDCSYRIWQ